MKLKCGEITVVTVTLSRDLLLLCEGEADREFFRKLCANRPGMPDFDIFPNDKLHGNGAYGRMLEAVRGDAAHFPKIKGILIVADRMDLPAAPPDLLFANICGQIAAAGFGIPAAPLALGVSAAPPAIAVMFLPDETTSGGLETLLAQEIIAKHPDVEECIHDFIRCDNLDVQSWPAEKRDKARFHSMVAVLNRDDPSKAASKAFKDPNPLVDVTAPCFDEVARRLRDFEANVRAIS